MFSKMFVQWEEELLTLSEVICTNLKRMQFLLLDPTIWGLSQIVVIMQQHVIQPLLLPDSGAPWTKTCFLTLPPGLRHSEELLLNTWIIFCRNIAKNNLSKQTKKPSKFISVFAIIPLQCTTITSTTAWSAAILLATDNAHDQTGDKNSQSEMALLLYFCDWLELWHRPTGWGSVQANFRAHHVVQIVLWMIIIWVQNTEQHWVSGLLFTFSIAK